jgi:hypothetical protein
MKVLGFDIEGKDIRQKNGERALEICATDCGAMSVCAERTAI